MVELLTMENAAALLTLTMMEIVLGIDNIVFIAILCGKLPEERRDYARKLGLFLAMFMRIVLLLGISWIMGLTAPLFNLGSHEISGRDLILLLGGAFLVYKAVHEIHDKMEGSMETLHEPRVAAKFSSVIGQIIMLDIVFSLDSVITAVGMVKQQPGQTWQPLAIMITAVVISIFVMLVFSGGITRFINKHPTTKMLALAFLLLIGVMLIGEGFGQHIPKGYIYSAMTFAIFVELLNIRTHKAHKSSTAEPAKVTAP